MKGPLMQQQSAMIPYKSSFLVIRVIRLVAGVGTLQWFHTWLLQRYTLDDWLRTYILPLLPTCIPTTISCCITTTNIILQGKFKHSRLKY